MKKLITEGECRGEPKFEIYKLWLPPKTGCRIACVSPRHEVREERTGVTLFPIHKTRSSEERASPTLTGRKRKSGNNNKETNVETN